ncbi:MAG: NupC/NupG family nucleoside CNT transporter [Myxococcales bacterium]|nr:NupC/NupG family nucleoside CNT transporter [Myxococcales bacterium]
MMLLWAASAHAQQANYLPAETSVLDRLASFVGLFGILAVAWLMSENRWAVRWRTVAWGVGLQLLLGLVLLAPAMSVPSPWGPITVDISQFFYTVVDGGVRQLLAFSEEGATFVFSTIEAHQIAAPDGSEQLIVGRVSPPLKTFAFWILPTIIFFSSLMSLLYHLGIMQVLVRAIAWVMQRTLGTSGAESLSAAGNIFVGQTEAPLLVRPFVQGMTRSELMAVMTGGFATVAGGVMGAYVQFLQGVPNIAGHLVMASIMSAPAALACAKLMVPETEESATDGDVRVTFPKTATNAVEAAANGAADGMKLALNVAAMLIAIVALVAFVDWGISWVPLTQCTDGWTLGYACTADEGTALSLSHILGVVFAPLALLMGVPWEECGAVGRLLGEKIVLTEFVAYIHLGEMIRAPEAVLSERSAVISSYALCGFANFASIGIQLGGIGGIAPSRMGDLAALGFRAMWAGMLAACMTGAVAGILL